MRRIPTAIRLMVAVALLATTAVGVAAAFAGYLPSEGYVRGSYLNEVRALALGEVGAMVGIAAGQTLVQVPQPSDLKNSPRFTVIATRPPAEAERNRWWNRSPGGNSSAWPETPIF
jgi:hypothetical protein